MRDQRCWRQLRPLIVTSAGAPLAACSGSLERRFRSRLTPPLVLTAAKP